MRPGRHAAGDGSFARSARGATFRGLALLAVAVVLGIILLNTTDNPRGTTLASGKSPRPVATVSTLPPPTTVATRAPHDVRVLPANSTSVNGAGARIGNTLKALGYDVLAATTVTQQAKASEVLFEPGYDHEAGAVAVALNLPATAAQPLPVPPPFDTKGANVTVWIGPDLAPTTTPTTAQTTTANTTPTQAPTTVAPSHPSTTTAPRSTTTVARSTSTTKKA